MTPFIDLSEFQDMKAMNDLSDALTRTNEHNPHGFWLGNPI
jgi:hypothetical protein